MTAIDDRLPRPLPERHHRPQRGLHPDDAGHAGALLRAVEPRRDPARRSSAASRSSWPSSPSRACRINFAGLLLILFGIVLLIAEIKVVSHGVLAIGGVIAMALGSLMLFDAPEVGFRVSWSGRSSPRWAPTAGLFLFVIAAGAARADGAPPCRRHRRWSGQTGRRPRARWSPEGQVLVHGELWRAVIRGGPDRGRRARARGRRERLDAHRREGGEREACHDLRWSGCFTLVVVVAGILFFLGLVHPRRPASTSG